MNSHGSLCMIRQLLSAGSHVSHGSELQCQNRSQVMLNKVESIHGLTGAATMVLSFLLCDISEIGLLQLLTLLTAHFEGLSLQKFC